MGVVIFSVFMISSFVQVLTESLGRLWKGGEVAVIPVQGIIVMVVTIALKSVVWISCRKVKSSSVEALSQDAENDVIFNVFSLLFPWIGQRLEIPWLDPLGGALLSIYIIFEWTQTLWTNSLNLTGKRASAEDHQKMIYLVTRFSPLIKAINHIEVFQSGDQQIVECDVVLDRETTLPIAHDLGESIQVALESLEGVERAYVHVDFLATNPSSHKPK